ncbi:MAG: restriction endonuclease, partial [Deltaproteobacteria bacterium]|nr:restriction endonuclease [Deltaproteobacteria bacterium]
GEQVIIAEHDLYDIDRNLLDALGIFEFTMGIKVEKDGIIKVNDVHYHPKIMRNPSQKAVYEKIGNIVRIDDEYFLLSSSQAELLNEIAAYNSDEERTRDFREQYAVVHKIKDLMRTHELPVDDSYAGYNPVFVSDIELGIKTISDEEIELYPRLLEEAADFTPAFNEQFDRISAIHNSYHIEYGGQTYDLVLSEANQETLAGIRKHKNKKGKAEITRFLDEVEDHIPHIKYSKRVIGWGPVKMPALAREASPLIWVEEIDEEGQIETSLSVTATDGQPIQIPLDLDPTPLEEAWQQATDREEETVQISIEGQPVQVSREQLGQVIQVIRQYHEDAAVIKEPVAEKPIAMEEPRPKTDASFVQIKEQFTELEYIEEVAPLPLASLEIPRAVAEQQEWSLFDYQQVGLSWLQNLYYSIENGEGKLSVQRPAGGLLADDMGLGKTIQILSFLVWLHEKGILRNALLIMPKTLIKNWTSEADFYAKSKGEIEKFFPKGELSPVAFIDSQQLRTRLGFYPLQEYIELARHNIVVTSYETIMNYCKTERHFQQTFGIVDWDVIVCDEAQRIKNPRTKRTIAVKALKAGVKIACTATPVENYMDELWSICDWILPGTLGSLSQFRKEYVHKKEAGGVEVHNSIADKLRNHYIRRTKDEVLHDRLPTKTIVVEKIAASSQQAMAYKQVQRSIRQDKHILGYIGRLIGMMSHPEFGIAGGEFRDPLRTMEAAPKFEWLHRTLAEIRERQEKVILFTPSKWIQRAIQKFVVQTMALPHVPIINGDTHINARLQDIDRAQAGRGFGVMILSPEVAGFGLNITEFNHVIHFSRGWNPAKENQATDRVYRIGQQKPVSVYIPVMTWGDPGASTYSSNEDYYSDEVFPERPTPEENLDILMRRKGSMLKNFFSVAASINPQDLLQGILIEDRSEGHRLGLLEVMSMCDHYQFEALVALLFEQMGYDTRLTPRTNDYGVDLIAEKGDDPPLLLQITRTDPVPVHKIKEVIAAQAIYQERLKRDCALGIVLSSYLPKPSKKWTMKHHIEVFDWSFLNQWNHKTEFGYPEVLARDNERVAVVG